MKQLKSIIIFLQQPQIKISGAATPLNFPTSFHSMSVKIKSAFNPHWLRKQICLTFWGQNNVRLFYFYLYGIMMDESFYYSGGKVFER